MTGLTYDAGALLSAERPRGKIWALHWRALERGLLPAIPTTVLAQAWRGGPQAGLSRLLQGCEVEGLDERAARHAGTLCGLTRTADVVDASVVASAVTRGDAIVTTDVADIQRLVEASGARLHVIAI